MRIDVKKFLFVGSEQDRKVFFHKAQEAGLIDFIGSVKQKEMPIELQQTIRAIKIVRHLPVQEQEENLNLFNPDTIVNEIVSLHEENEKLLEQIRVLEVEIARIDQFGDFSLEDVEYIEKIGKKKIQFFAGKPTLFQDKPIPEGLIFVTSEHNLDYYVAINPQRVQYEKMVEIKIEQPLGVLQKKYAEALKKQKLIEHQLNAYSKFNKLLHHHQVNLLNKYHLFTVQNYVQGAMDGKLFAIEGWIPANKIADVEQFVKPLHVHAEEIAIEPTDIIPTYLENKGLSEIGEDVVKIYDTPSAADKDPSLWVLGSFILFFSFIVADAGYGLVYLALALFLRYKFPNLKGTGKRIINLFTLLAIGSVIWGVLITSFFGVNLAPDNPLRKFSLLQWLAEKKAAYHIIHQDSAWQDWITKYPELETVKDPHQFVLYNDSEILTRFNDNILFELALFIGIVHISLSLLRYIKRNWHGAGWIAFLFGAFLYFAAYLEVPSLFNYAGGINLERGGVIGLNLMIGGIIFAVVGSIIKNGFTGVFELMNIIQLFADTLSYLRLYALGLAGAIVGATINEIAGTAPLMIGVLLILVAHFINIGLGTMSGVIHGLRLNFIEWYHYSFEGGGKEFKPLKLLKIE